MADVAPDDPGEWMQWRFRDSHASAGEPGSPNHTRYEFARHTAPSLAQAALPGHRVVAHLAPTQVSLRTVLFATDDDAALVVVVGSHEPKREVEKALPYSLEHVGDRDLVLVIPHLTEWPFLARLPWLDHHTRVFTHDDGSLTEHRVPLRPEVLAAVRTVTEASTYELSAEHEGWADEVIHWADGHVRLQPSHRKGYLGWQVDGRLVLKISRARGGRLRIAAGVNPGSKSPGATGVQAVIDGPLVDPEPFREAVRQAIANRLRGDDIGNVEHRFQARLQLLPAPERLGLTTLIPEYPANRPIPGGQGSGSIDFVGVDDHGRLHVVETKVGASEPTVLLQALDYWVWAEANRAELAASVGADPDLPTALSVVVLPAADGSVLHRQNGHVADRLSRNVPLDVWTASVGLDGSLRLLPVHVREIKAGGRWVDRMRRRTYGAVALGNVGPGTADDPVGGVFPGSAAAATRLREAGGLHGFVDRPHSSQRFALDLFGSLDESGVRKLLTPFFGGIRSAGQPRFEWTDEHDALSERTPSRPARTQVDVILEGTTIAEQAVALLVEVKLTEAQFGNCSHAEVAPLPNRSTCGESGPFGNDPDSCWQLRNRDAGDRRRYDQVLQLARVDSVDVAQGCWFRERNQPMRLAAMASALEATSRYDRAVAALTAPSGHASIRRRWTETAAMVDEGRMGLVDPETVAAALQPDAQAFLIDRYGLGPPMPVWHDQSVKDVLGWSLAAELLACHPDALQLIETHPTGGLYDCLTLRSSSEDDRTDGGHIDINLEGSLHAWRPAGVTVSMRDVWDRLAGGELHDVVRWCERELGLPAPDETVAWPQSMAVLAQHFLGRARWRNGVCDSSGYDGGVRRELFDVMPAVADACRPQRNNIGGVPEYRFWFLVDQRNRPLAAVEVATKRGWYPNDRVFDLSTSADVFVQHLLP